MEERHKQTAREILRLSAQTRSLLSQAMEKLDSAGSWGIFDMLGGGLISTMVKHSRVGEAKSLMQRAKARMEQMARLLESAPLPVDIDAQIDSFAVFADYFWDGLFADLYVQRKIRDMQSNVRRAIEELHRVDAALERILRA